MEQERARIVADFPPAFREAVLTRAENDIPEALALAIVILPWLDPDLVQ